MRTRRAGTIAVLFVMAFEMTLEMVFAVVPERSSTVRLRDVLPRNSLLPQAYPTTHSQCAQDLVITPGLQKILVCHCAMTALWAVVKETTVGGYPQRRPFPGYPVEQVSRPFQVDDHSQATSRNRLLVRAGR